MTIRLKFEKLQQSGDKWFKVPDVAAFTESTKKAHMALLAAEDEVCAYACMHVCVCECVCKIQATYLKLHIFFCSSHTLVYTASEVHRKKC